MSENEPNLHVNDIRVFVPARNFAESLRFYTRLGWTLNWQTDDASLAELELAGNRILLQNFYVKDWAHNFVFYISVDDAYAWHAHVSQILASEAFGDARVKSPVHEAHGALTTHVWDPGGLLIKFSQMLND